MMYKKEKIIDNSEPNKKLFWFLVMLLVFCLFSYGYCVRGAIVNIVERQNMEAKLSALNTKVVDLESQYIKIKNSITPELALNLGFISLSEAKYVLKNAKAPGLSLVSNSN